MLIFPLFLLKTVYFGDYWLFCGQLCPFWQLSHILMFLLNFPLFLLQFQWRFTRFCWLKFMLTQMLLVLNNYLLPCLPQSGPQIREEEERQTNVIIHNVFPMLFHFFCFCYYYPHTLRDLVLS